jgi:serine/threonine protein kinase
MLNNTVKNHLSTDIWALGCTIYKFFHGKTPFKANSEYLIFDNILNNRLIINKELSSEVINLIERLLVTDCSKRLGCGEIGSEYDFEALKRHEFFKDIDFESLYLSPSPVKINQHYVYKKISSESVNKSLDDSNRSSLNINISNNCFSTNVDSMNNSPMYAKKEGVSEETSPIGGIKNNTCSSFALNKKISDFSFDSFIETNPQDHIIEDYINNPVRSHFNSFHKSLSGEEENTRTLVREGIIQKKSPWFHYNERKLRLYSSSKLEYWNDKKNVLRVCLFYLIYLGYD